MSASVLHRYRLPLAISSWVTFAISLVIYWITADPGVSYWDCPEYVTVASKMEIGHPPGNPIWMLTMRVATILFPSSHHAYVINLCSGLMMAFASFFLSRLIFIPTILCFHNIRITKVIRESFTKLLSCFVACGSALCFTFCDSAWYSAVEAEVYAMSAFLSAVSLWIMMVWWFENDRGRQYRLLILVAYITGLSLGVHQLNLLLIPVFFLMVLYRSRKRISLFKVWFCLAVSILTILGILLVMMPGLLAGAKIFELYCVNSLGWGYDSGLILFGLTIFSLVVFLLLLTGSYGYRWRNLSLGIWIFAFLFLGYSSFAMILIRAKTYPLMNEGSPSDIFALESYISREQYPSIPLVYGQTPYSRPMFEEHFIDGNPRYSRYILEKGEPIYQKFMTDGVLHPRSGMLSGKDSLENQKIMESAYGYLLSDYNFTQKLTPELNMWFPRITSRNTADRLAYDDWADMNENTMERVSISETIDSNGVPQPKISPSGERISVFAPRPTYMQHFRYFVTYQSYYMYFRYLFWNFIGRQNDYPSVGEIEHGNFITGFPVFDKAMIGDTDYYPAEIWKDNRGRNRYFGIPFFFGIIGIIWLASGNRKSRRLLTLITLLFIMTGLAIVVYLNQLPGEPRERDYTFLGSYMAFVLWIGAGFVAVSYWIMKYLPAKLGLVMVLLLILCPATLMAIENFDDHNRSGRYEPTFYASSILDYEYPAIIFSHGDNSSFPLWYGSEVLGMGPEHTPVDITYLSLPSYVINLKQQREKGVETMVEIPKIAFGKYLLSYIPSDRESKALPLVDLLYQLYNTGDDMPAFTNSKFLIPTSGGDSTLINLHSFTKGSSYLSFKHLMLLDFMAVQLHSEKPRVLFFPSLIDHSFYAPLDSVLHPALFGKIYAPWITDSIAGEMLKTSVKRELQKLVNLTIESHYSDPLITDRSRRYRGELVIAATELLDRGDTLTPALIADILGKKLPYTEILPGSFTVADSTYYEGKEFRKLLSRLYESTGEPRFQISGEKLDSLMQDRHRQWIKFYKALSPTDRATLSNRSKRLLMK